MEKIKPLLERSSKKFGKDSSASLIEVGQTDPHQRSPSTAGVEESEAGFDSEAVPDGVDAINQIFAEFEFAYHNQFHKAFADAESLAIAKKYWLSSLENYLPTQIVRAAKKVIRSQDYLPSIATLVRACEEGFDLFGLPAPHSAYFEPVRHRRRSESSHGVIQPCIWPEHQRAGLRWRTRENRWHFPALNTTTVSCVSAL